MNRDVALIETATGVLRGANGAVRAFKGVPYAAAPVGELRWRAPQPAKAWAGERDALRFGPICPQPGAHPPHGMSEDCLTLNIWTPAGASGLPVMVWFHGGGWRRGAGSSGRTHGENLASQGVVIVTVNFRLGILGFMAHPPCHRNPRTASHPTMRFSTSSLPLNGCATTSAPLAATRIT